MLLANLESGSVWEITYHEDHTKSNRKLGSLPLNCNNFKNVKIINSNKNDDASDASKFLTNIAECVDSIHELNIEDPTDQLFAAINILPNKQTNVQILVVSGPYVGNIGAQKNFPFATTVIMIDGHYDFLSGTKNIERLCLSEMNLPIGIIAEIIDQNEKLHDCRLQGKQANSARKPDLIPISKIREAKKAEHGARHFKRRLNQQTVNMGRKIAGSRAELNYNDDYIRRMDEICKNKDEAIDNPDKPVENKKGTVDNVFEYDTSESTAYSQNEEEEDDDEREVSENEIEDQEDCECDLTRLHDILQYARPYSTLKVSCDDDYFQYNGNDKSLVTSNLSIPHSFYTNENSIMAGAAHTENTYLNYVKNVSEHSGAFEIVGVIVPFELSKLISGMLGSSIAKLTFPFKLSTIKADSTDFTPYVEMFKVDTHVSLNLNDSALAAIIPANVITLRMFFNMKARHSSREAVETMLTQVSASAFSYLKTLILAKRWINDYDAAGQTKSSTNDTLCESNGFLYQIVKEFNTSEGSLAKYFPKLEAVESSIFPIDSMELFERLMVEISLNIISIRYEDDEKEIILKKLEFLRGLEMDWRFEINEQHKRLMGYSVSTRAFLFSHVTLCSQSYGEAFDHISFFNRLLSHTDSSPA